MLVEPASVKIIFVARDGNDPSFFDRKSNVLPLDERAKLEI